MPLGRWLRPTIAAGITAAIAIGAWVAKAYAEGDLARIAKKYPAIAAGESAKALIPGLPFVNLFVPIDALIDKAARDAAGMTEEDRQALDLDHVIVTWAPVVGIAGLAIGGILTFYFLWVDVFRSPVEAQRLHELRLAGISATGQAAGVAIPAAATGGAAPAVVAASRLPAAGNPETFERGTKARAVRDVLAEHIEEGGGAREPYAVATAKVKEEGPVKAAEGLPPSEVKAELREQTEAAHT